MLARGESERAACLRAGIGLTAWNVAKRNSADLRERIASARDDWARLRHPQHAAALYEGQAARSATRKALKPQPTHQTKLLVRYRTTRVPLNLAAIPETEIVQACERSNFPIETWRRQERAFGVLQKVYPNRAAICGQQHAKCQHLIVGQAQCSKIRRTTTCNENRSDGMKYWEAIADNLSKAGWSWGCVRR